MALLTLYCHQKTTTFAHCRDSVCATFELLITLLIFVNYLVNFPYNQILFSPLWQSFPLQTTEVPP